MKDWNLMLLQKRSKLQNKNFSNLRKEYRERRTAGLRDAVAARNEADKAIQEELKALGGSYRYRISSPSFF